MSNYLGPDKVMEMKKEYLCPPGWNHFYKNPPQIVKGKMQYLYDHEGKQYLDCFAGVSVMSCGHCNEAILNPMIQQMQTLQHTTIIYLTQQMVQLAEKLADVLPGNLRRSFFCCSGSEANETAILMARLYTGKKEILGLPNGLHGRTYMTMSATAIPMWRSDPSLSEDAYIAKDREIESIKELIEERGKENIAALIVEPIQGNGGIITPSQEYFKDLKALLEANDILLIVDEIQTGFARTGKMFAIEHYGIVPDIMTVAKALGNGTPISAACTSDEIAMKFNKPSASTFGGNPVSAVAGIAVLDYIKENNLMERSEKLGAMLKEGLCKLQQKYSVIRDVRGLGLMLGAEICTEDGNACPELVDDILEEMKDRGYIVGKNGVERNVLAFQPPLVLTEQDIEGLLQALEEVFELVEESSKG